MLVRSRVPLSSRILGGGVGGGGRFPPRDQTFCISLDISVWPKTSEFKLFEFSLIVLILDVANSC